MTRIMKNIFRTMGMIAQSITNLLSINMLRSAFDFRKLLRARNAYRLFIFLVFLAGIIVSYFLAIRTQISSNHWLIDIIIPYTIYFVTALAGFNLLLKQHNRFSIVTQIGFLVFSFLLFSGDLTYLTAKAPKIYREINTGIFIVCVTFLFFYFEFALLSKKSTLLKNNEWWYISGATVVAFLVDLGMYIYRPFPEMWFAFLFIAGIYLIAIIAIIAIIKYVRKTHSKIYLIFFQAALASSISVFYKIIFPKSFLIKGIIGLYFIGMVGITAASILYFVVNILFFSFWRGRLVSAPKSSVLEKPISIYPEASTYIDVHHRAAWLKQFIETSDGGVLGLTGLRGAGKSALLNKVISDLKGEYFTLHITSPVYSSDRMEFFMMVCREVCTKVISEIEEKVFRIKTSSSAKAKEGLFFSIRIIVLLLIIGAGLWFLPAIGFNPLKEDFSWEKYQVLETNQEITHNYQLSEYFYPIIYATDSTCIQSLIGELNNFLNDTSSTFDAIVIVPNSPRGMLKVLPVHSNEFNPKRFHKIFASNYYTAHEFNFNKSDSLLTSTFGTEFREDVMYYFYYNQITFKGMYSNIDLFKKIGMKLRQTDKFMHRYDTFLADEVIDSSNNRYPILWFCGADILLLNIARLETFTSDAGRMFDVDNRFTYPPDTTAVPVSSRNPHKLMSWILLEGYYKGAVAENTSHLILHRGRQVRHLRDLLVVYMETLYPKYEPTGLDNSSFFMKLAPTVKNNIWFILLVVVFLVVLVGPLIVRGISNFMYRIINFKTYGLLLRSKDFLRILSYSETKGKIGELSLPKGLRFSASQMLTERNLTLPALTNRFIDYIKEASELFNRKIIIAIDELDKIDDPAVVKHILQEVKGALFVKNTYYLISISEDAARSFEKRLSTGRDIIESTFDELITIHRLDCEQSWSIIERRLYENEKNPATHTPDKVPVTQQIMDQRRTNAESMTLLAGGIPREIIRNLRDIIIEFKDLSTPTPVQVCIFLFTKKIEDYLCKVDEIQIPGKSSLRLYRKLKEVQRILSGRNLVTKQSVLNVTKMLEDAVKIVDPQELRYSVTSTSEEKLFTRYKAIEDDIKTLIELLIRARVLLFYATGEQNNSMRALHIRRRIFSAYDALDSNPALAQHILNVEDSSHELHGKTNSNAKE